MPASKAQSPAPLTKRKVRTASGRATVETITGRADLPPDFGAFINAAPPPDWPYEFSIGDQVRLKSGGHRMVVRELHCDGGTCGDPYKGALTSVTVMWSQSSQLDGDDLCTEDLPPELLTTAVMLPHEGFPF